ncbi:protein kinase [Streptomyces sp. NPDC059740]|uniref:serine/threonine-protein kinase n=1 Tax=Streptomyces sp. NPDC059740 TaxID=3346926 RepID=UPI003658993A
MPGNDGRLVAGRYRMLEQIGRGGMGTVWRAHDELLARQVAVKRLHVSPELAADELATRNERTRREAQAAARINHPNVVSVHDVVEDEGLPCIVMEYVPSRTLGDAIKENAATRAEGTGPLDPAEAARIGRGMVAALRAAHHAGVLHRDVKPGNVLLGEDGRVVLTDFGIAVASGTTTLTKTGELIGSIDYLAPEIVKGGTPTAASDLWALGATLYQALEGRPPFRRDTAVETAYAIATGELTPPRNAGPLKALVEALLAQEPELRPGAAAVEQALRAPAAEPETAHYTLSGDWHRGAATPGRHTHEDTGPSGYGPAPQHEASTAPGAATQTPQPGAHTPQPGAHTPQPGAHTPQPGAHTPQPGLPGQLYFSQSPTLSPYTAGRSETAGGARRAAVWAVVGFLVVAALTGGVALWLMRDDGTRTADAHVSENPTGDARPTHSPSASASPDLPPPPALPAGFHRVAEPEFGYAIPVPDGWSRQVRQGRGVTYHSPNGPAYLKVDILPLPSADQVGHFKDVEEDLRAQEPGYQRMRLEGTQYQGQEAAIWEFRIGSTHAIDLGFGADGKEYALYLSSPDGKWDANQGIFSQAQAGFRRVTADD